LIDIKKCFGQRKSLNDKFFKSHSMF